MLLSVATQRGQGFVDENTALIRIQAGEPESIRGLRAQDLAQLSPVRLYFLPVRLRFPSHVLLCVGRLLPFSAVGPRIVPFGEKNYYDFLFLFLNFKMEV